MVLKALIFKLRDVRAAAREPYRLRNFNSAVCASIGGPPDPSRVFIIIPTEYRYFSGAYNIAYVYGGNIYTEERISYRLSIIEYILSV